MWGRFAKAVFKGEHKFSGWTWTGIIIAIVYAVWPFDLLTDYVLPVFGFADDLGFWGLAALLIGREKSRWEQAFGASAIEVDASSTT